MDQVSKSSSKEMKKTQRNQKNDDGKMKVKKKTKLEEYWSLSKRAHASGMSIKSTGGEGENKKYHYKTFEFRSTEYELEDSVMLNPEDINGEPYVAIIKDIYVQGEEEEEKYVKIEVQWFYRPKDVDKRYVKNWKSRDSREVFYSFHRDEVDAESVKDSCTVNFVPTNKQIPNRIEHPGFIVQNVYDVFKKKLLEFDSDDFNEIQRNELDLLVARTSSRVGQLPDTEKEIVERKNPNVVNASEMDLFVAKTSSRVGHHLDTQKEKSTFKSRRKQSVPKRSIHNVETTRELTEKENADICDVVKASEIDLLVAETSSRVDTLPDTQKEKKTFKSRRKQSVPKRFINSQTCLCHKNVERTTLENINVVNASEFRSVSK